MQAFFQQCCGCLESSARGVVEGSLRNQLASLCCLLAMCPSGGYCTPLSLVFLVCTTGVIIVPPLGFAVRVK